MLDPEKKFGADWFVGGDKQAVWLDLCHVELDIEDFLAYAAEGPASGTGRGPDRVRAALEAAETRYGGDFLEEDPNEDWAVGVREEAQAAYISLTRLLADGRPRPGTRTARPASTSGSSNGTSTTRRPMSGWSARCSSPVATARPAAGTGSTPTGWRRWAWSRAVPVRARVEWPAAGASR